MKNIFISMLLLLPLSAFAAVPAFPMSFYGIATVNGDSAPVGTIIRAYYGTTLAGEVTLAEAGVYGYNSPIAQQLLVAEGTGTIRFTVKGPAINEGIETAGDTVQTHMGFTAGENVAKNFAFTWTAPTPPPTPSPAPSPAPVVSSGGGGGGGGGGGTSVLYGCMDKKATNYSSIANRDNGACLFPSTVAATTTRSSSSTPIVSLSPAPTAPKPKGEVLGVAAFVFTHNLNIGSTGTDVSELQKRLTAEGFYSGPISGYFGPLTAAAVKKFQSARGLEVVGNVGPKTRGVLNQQGTVLGAATTSVSVTIPAPKPTPERAEMIRQLLAMIQELQKQLAALKAR